MGREIRRVPKDWEHPKMENDDCFQPMYDTDYDTAAEEWLRDCKAWEDGTHEDCAEYKSEHRFFWDWETGPPDMKYYRPKFENADCFQMYETVSEGSPVSPVFKSKKELEDWLVAVAGQSRTAAIKFCKDGYVCSGVYMHGVGYKEGIDALNFV